MSADDRRAPLLIIIGHDNVTASRLNETRINYHNTYNERISHGENGFSWPLSDLHPRSATLACIAGKDGGYRRRSPRSGFTSLRRAVVNWRKARQEPRYPAAWRRSKA